MIKLGKQSFSHWNGKDRFITVTLIQWFIYLTKKVFQLFLLSMSLLFVTKASRRWLNRTIHVLDKFEKQSR